MRVDRRGLALGSVSAAACETSVAGVFGLIGFSGRPEREAGQLDRGWTLIERSTAAQPRSGHGAPVQAGRPEDARRLAR